MESWNKPLKSDMYHRRRFATLGDPTPGDPGRHRFQQSQAPTLDAGSKKFGLVISLFLTAITASVLSFAAPRFRALLSAFDAEIPWWSNLVINGYSAAWLLPVAVGAVWFAWPKPHEQSALALGIGVISLLVVLPLCILALCLPIFNLAASG